MATESLERRAAVAASSRSRMLSRPARFHTLVSGSTMERRRASPSSRIISPCVVLR